MKLRVQLFGRLGTNLGSDIELEFSVEPTIRNVIQILIKKDPILESMLLKNSNLSPGTILLINGHPFNRSEPGLDKILKTRDKITLDRLGFLEIVGGG